MVSTLTWRLDWNRKTRVNPLNLSLRKILHTRIPDLPYLHVVAAEVAVLVEALDTVAGVTVLALALVHAHALAELCAEHTLGVGVAGVGDVAAVADDGVTVTPILAWWQREK